MFKNFKSLLDVMKAFPDKDTCFKFLEDIRWNGVVVSPFDATSSVYDCGNHKFKCRNSNKYFNVLTDSIFENTKIPLQTWFLAMFLVATHKRGISSYQLASDLSITQKSAWFLLSRIRYCMDHGVFNIDLSGTVELDETFYGGKNKNRHHDKKVANSQGRSFKDKTPILGAYQEEKSEIVTRPDKRNIDRVVKEKIVNQPAVVYTQVIADTKKDTLQPIILAKIERGSKVVTDEWLAYHGLNNTYDHRIVDHRAHQYVNEEGDTTNRMEGYWTILKKTLHNYYRVTPKHLHRYCNEISYRFNTRHMTNTEKINLLLQGTNKRLRYVDLINNK